MMKNFLSTVVAALVFTFAFTSCLKDEEAKFEITGGASYVMQELAQDSSFTYVPYFNVYSSSLEHKIVDVKMLASDKSLAMTKLSDYQWCTDNTLNIFSSPSELNATYNVTAFNANNETVTATLKVEFNEKDILGDMKIDTLYYKGDALNAVVDIPKNAVALGFSLCFFDQKESEYNRIFYYVAQDSYDFTGTLVPLAQQAKDGKITMKLNFDTDSQQDMMYFPQVRVGVMATSAHGVHRIYKTKMLSEKAQSF